MSLPFIIKLLFIPQTHNKKAISNQPYRNEQQDSFEIAFSLIIFPRHAKLFDSGLTFSTLVRILHISFLFCSKKFTISKKSNYLFQYIIFQFPCQGENPISSFCTNKYLFLGFFWIENPIRKRIVPYKISKFVLFLWYCRTFLKNQSKFNFRFWFNIFYSK